MGKLQRSKTVGASALLAFGLCFTACGPSQEEYDAERAKVEELRGELSEAQKRRAALEDKLSKVQARNSAMIAKLKLMGEDVEGLEESLDETRRALEELREREKQAKERLKTFRNLISRFKKMIASGQLRVRVVRNRMVVELPENVLFDSGKAELKKEGGATLVSVAKVLSDVKDRHFQVAGHTDNVPISTRQFRSNWALSTARAVNVVRLLIEKGKMQRDKLSAAGYADTEPVASNDTKAGKQQNRRIEIVLVPNLDELPDLSSLMEEDKPEKAKDSKK